MSMNMNTDLNSEDERFMQNQNDRSYVEMRPYDVMWAAGAGPSNDGMMDDYRARADNGAIEEPDPFHHPESEFMNPQDVVVNYDEEEEEDNWELVDLERHSNTTASETGQDFEERDAGVMDLDVPLREHTGTACESGHATHMDDRNKEQQVYMKLHSGTASEKGPHVKVPQKKQAMPSTSGGKPLRGRCARTQYTDAELEAMARMNPDKAKKARNAKYQQTYRDKKAKEAKEHGGVVELAQQIAKLRSELDARDRMIAERDRIINQLETQLAALSLRPGAQY